MTIASNCIPKESFSSGISTFALAQAVAQSIGPTAGVKLKDLIGYNTSYVVTACMMFLSMLYVGLIVNIPDHNSGRLVLNFDNMIAKEVLLPAIISFLICVGFTSINSFFLIYAQERAIPKASLYFTVYAIMLMASRPLVGKLTDRYGFVKVAIPAILMTSLSLFLIGQSTRLWHLIAVAAVSSFGYGSVQPSLQSMCMKAVPVNKRGSASSTNYVAVDSGTLIGPLICGYVAKVFGYTPLMWDIMAICVLLALVFTLVFSKQLTKIEDDFEKKAADSVLSTKTLY